MSWFMFLVVICTCLWICFLFPFCTTIISPQNKQLFRSIPTRQHNVKYICRHHQVISRMQCHMTFMHSNTCMRAMHTLQHCPQILKYLSPAQEHPRHHRTPRCVIARKLATAARTTTSRSADSHRECLHCEPRR